MFCLRSFWFLLEAAIGFEPMNNGFADRRLCLISSIFLNTYIFIAFLWCDFWCNYFLDFSNLLAAKNGTHIPSAVQSVCVQVSFSSGVPMGAGTYPRPVSQDISGAVGSCFVPCCMNTLWTISITSISRHRLFACRLNNSLPTPGRKPPTHTQLCLHPRTSILGRLTASCGALQGKLSVELTVLLNRFIRCSTKIMLAHLSAEIISSVQQSKSRLRLAVLNEMGVDRG